MDNIHKVKSISIWIFLIPFIAVNSCLILITEFQWLFPNQEDIIHNTFPYFDGGASISRTARPYPSWLIFKPAMFLTSYLLIKYWLYNKTIIMQFDNKHKYTNRIIFFGIGSAIALIIHSLFLGIEFDNNFYKFFRRIIMLVFIIFEVAAQAYFVSTIYSFKNKILEIIDIKYLKLKMILVSLLIIAAIICVPIISFPGDKFKFVKHALEWNYFLGVIFFYLLTRFFWR